MTADILFIVGLLCALLAIPAGFTALSDRRMPRVAAILVLLAGGLIIAAVSMNPGAYSAAAVPEVVKRLAEQFSG